MRSPLAKVLVADSDARERRKMCAFLDRAGFSTRETDDGLLLLAGLESQTPHLVLTDLQLPSLGGLELCRRIKKYADVPIVVLTALKDEDTKISAIELYVEDYILKPARKAEVAARIRRILQRSWLSYSQADNSVRVDADLTLDFMHREAQTPAGNARLTPLESRLLQMLIRNAGSVLPTQLLLERLWGDPYGPANNLWEYVRRTRRKIGDRGTRPRYIVNEPGLGYRFTRHVRSETRPAD